MRGSWLNARARAGGTCGSWRWLHEDQEETREQPQQQSCRLDALDERTGEVHITMKVERTVGRIRYKGFIIAETEIQDEEVEALVLRFRVTKLYSKTRSGKRITLATFDSLEEEEKAL